MTFQHVETMKTRHGKRIMYYRPTRSHRYRLAAEPGTKEFEAAYQDAVAEHETLVAREKEKQPYRHREIVNALSRKLIKCRARDRERGMQATITLAWVVKELNQNNFCCALTGIPFQVANGETKVHPYSPSLDRIDSSKGYTPENTRIVLYAINAMMMDWGDDVFRHVVSGYVLRNLKV